MIPIAVLDANVLYPPAVRDLLLRLAGGLLYSPRFTDAIHNEWIRNVLRDRPDLTLAQLTRTRELMNRVDPQALVSGYEFRIPTLALPDPHDRHVLAAAIHANAGVIVTFNLRDFPASALSAFGVAAVHPDEFVCHLFDTYNEAVLERLRRQRAALLNPPRTSEQFVGTFRTNRLIRFTDRLLAHLDAL